MKAGELRCAQFNMEPMRAIVLNLDFRLKNFRVGVYIEIIQLASFIQAFTFFT